MSTLYFRDREQVSLSEVVFDAQVSEQLQGFLQEHQHIEALQRYNLPVANKILMYGKTGCGKTMTAKAIADYLNKPIFIVNLATIVSSKLGETARNVHSVFKEANYENSVLFFDEFDSLGQTRDLDQKDSSEMKRVVNALLQLIDNFPKNSILIAATNQIQMIDEALVRRFQLKLEFALPSSEVLDQYYNQLLEKFPSRFHTIDRLYGISFSEAKDLIFTQIKKQVILEEMMQLHKNA